MYCSGMVSHHFSRFADLKSLIFFQFFEWCHFRGKKLIFWPFEQKCVAQIASMGIYNGVIKKPVISPVFMVTFQQNSLIMFRTVNSLIIKIRTPTTPPWKKLSWKNLIFKFFHFWGSLPGHKLPKIHIWT